MIGDSEVTLNNAAEEATMQKILAALSQGGNTSTSVDNLDKSSKKVKVSFDTLEKSTNKLNVAFNVLGRAMGGIVGLVGGLAKAGSGAVSFATGLADSQPNVVDFAKGVKSVTGDILGMGTALEAVITLLYKNYTTFQQLSTSGIAFGDRLEEMTRYGAAVGTSLDVVAGNLTKNAEFLGMMGTATRGATLAVQLQSQAFDQNSRMLQTFGLSFEEQNERFMTFFAQNAIAMQRGTMSQRQVVDLSDDYAKGLRRLSELTGVQADQIEEGVQKANMNRAFENFISTMDGETANRMRSIINTAQTAFGDSGREAAMAMMMGVAPVTEGAQQLTSMMPGFNQMFSGLTSQARGFTGSLDDFNNMMYGQMNQYANANRAFADANSAYFGTLDLMGDPYGRAGSEIVRFVNMFGGNLQDLESRLGAESPLQGAINSFNTAIAGVRDALTTQMVDLLRSPAFQNAMTALTTNIPLMGQAIENFLGDMGTEEGRAKRWDDIMTWFKELLANMTTLIADAVTGGGSQTIRSIETGSTVSQGALQTLLGGGAQIDADVLLGQASRNQAGEGTGGFMDRYGFLGLGGGYQSYLQQVMEEAMESGNYATDQEARDAVLQALQTYATNQKEAGTYTEEQFQQVLNFLQDDVNETLQGITTRALGTYGATGQMVEPRDTLSKIHAGERVLNEFEAARYNAQTTQTTNTNVDVSEISRQIATMANKLVDENREGTVKLTRALNTLEQRMRDMIKQQRDAITAIEMI